MDEWYKMVIGNNEEIKILIPDFGTGRKNSKETIARAKILIDKEILKSIEEDFKRSLYDLWCMVDEAEVTKEKKKKE